MVFKDNPSTNYFLGKTVFFIAGLKSATFDALVEINYFY
jgi:hypothetical protein